MTSAGSSGGLPPSNIPTTKATGNTDNAQNSTQAQSPQNAPQARKSGTPKSADKNTPIMSDKAATASYAQVAGQINKTSHTQEAAKTAAGTSITLSDGSKLELDFSKVHSSTLRGIQSTEFEGFDDDDDGTGITDADKELLSAAFKLFHAV